MNVLKQSVLNISIGSYLLSMLSPVYPNGLNLQGAGFINVHQAILTTGQVKNTEHGLAYNVQKGKVNIQANPNHLGLGGRHNADYVHIYSQALEVNAEIHANRAIKVISGQNEINEREGIKNSNPNTQQPEFAVDVKHLGGMYADHIYLVGTAQGLGVRQAGRLQAKHQIFIDAQGKVELFGHTNSTGDRINLVPMQSVLNRRDYKAMEKYFLDELKVGKNVSMKIDISYPNDNSQRPSLIRVTAMINGRQLKPYEFDQ